MRWYVAAIVMVLTRSSIADPVHRERAALVAIDLGPSVPTYLRAKATTEIEEGLAAAGYEVLPTARAGAQLTGELATCREGACVRTVAGALGVDSVVFATIANKDDSSIITMRLYDASGQRVAEAHEVCDLCGESELTERVGVAASALRSQAVEFRERNARRTAQARPAEIVDSPRSPERRSPAPGLAIGATGAAMIGVGIYLIAIDGRGTCSPGDHPVYPAVGAVIRYPDPADPGVYICRDIYRTKALGVVGIGVGIAAVAAGVALVVRTRRGDRAIVLEPAVGGATLKASLSW